MDTIRNIPCRLADNACSTTSTSTSNSSSTSTSTSTSSSISTSREKGLFDKWHWKNTN